jgi:hypothetical protein
MNRQKPIPREHQYQYQYTEREKKQHHATFLRHLQRVAAELTAGAASCTRAALKAYEAAQTEQAAGLPPAYIQNILDVASRLHLQAIETNTKAEAAREQVNQHEEIQKQFDRPRRQAEQMEG